MVEFQYTVKDPNGIHARPAGLLVKLAQQLACSVTITRGEKKADMKRLFALMGLGVKCGDVVTVCLDGADEAEAATRLEAFFQENF